MEKTSRCSCVIAVGKCDAQEYGIGVFQAAAFRRDRQGVFKGEAEAQCCGSGDGGSSLRCEAGACDFDRCAERLG